MPEDDLMDFEDDDDMEDFDNRDEEVDEVEEDNEELLQAQVIPTTMTTQESFVEIKKIQLRLEDIKFNKVYDLLLNDKKLVEDEPMFSRSGSPKMGDFIDKSKEYYSFNDQYQRGVNQNISKEMIKIDRIYLEANNIKPEKKNRTII